MKELFRKLTEEYGVKVGLATTDTYASARACMDCLDASGYVTFWGTDDGTLPVKPDGKLVELAAESWNALALGVLSGTGKIHHMECVADDLIESVAELPAWLEGKRGENNGRN